MTKANNLAQSERQADIESIDWSKDIYARVWIDVSLQERLVEKTACIRRVATILGKSEGAVRSWAYRHMLPNGFEDYWLDKYRDYYQKRLAPRGYAKLNDLVDKEKDISKVVMAIQQAEGKQQAPTVQINNFVKTEKNTYGI